MRTETNRLAELVEEMEQLLLDLQQYSNLFPYEQEFIKRRAQELIHECATEFPILQENLTRLAKSPISNGEPFA